MSEVSARMVRVAMRQILPVVVLFLASLSGCLGLVPDEAGTANVNEPPKLKPHETDDATVPAAGNNRLSLHVDPDRDPWMETGPAGPGSITGTSTFLGEETYSFPLQPDLARSLSLAGKPAVLHLDYGTGVVAGNPPDLEAKLMSGGQVIATGTAQGPAGGPTEISLPIPTHIPKGPLELLLCVCPRMATLTADWALELGPATYLELPILAPVFVPPAADALPAPATAVVAEATARYTPIETGQDANGWFAARTATFGNGVDASKPLDVDFETVAGGVDVSTGSGDAYLVTVHLRGMGDTEQAAIQRLEAIELTHRDEPRDGGTLVGTRAHSPQWQDQSARISARLPDRPLREGQATTTSGGVSLSNLQADEFAAETTSGGIDARDVTIDRFTAEASSGGIDVEDAVFDRADLYTASGGVTVDAVVNELDAETTSGGIDAVLESTRTGFYNLQSTSGGVEVRVATASSIGYDATATASSGGTDIDLPDAEPVGEQTKQRKHARTTDFDSRSIQVEVTAATTSGGASITD